jgi:uncharacterized protein YecE (DUF72 family)
LYVTNSELNAVELNASFYRFPFPTMVKSWSMRAFSGVINVIIELFTFERVMRGS